MLTCPGGMAVQGWWSPVPLFLDLEGYPFVPSSVVAWVENRKEDLQEWPGET